MWGNSYKFLLRVIKKNGKSIRLKEINLFFIIFSGLELFLSLYSPNVALKAFCLFFIKVLVNY